MFTSLFALFARRRSFGVVVVFLLVGPGTAQGQSSPFAIRRIGEEFPWFSNPAIDAGRIAFWSRGPDDVNGIYEGPISGPFTRVVDQSMLIPGTDVPFDGVSARFGFDSGRVAIHDGAGANQGTYLFQDGAIQRIADQTTIMPSSTRTFSQFRWPPAVNDGRVVFVGQSDTTAGVEPLGGVYLARDGELSRIADTTMPSPGYAGNYTGSFQNPVLEDSKIAFVGNWPERSAIYLHDLSTGIQSHVVNINRYVPGQAGTISSLDLDDEKLVFTHRVSMQSGVYVTDITTGSLTTIAETGMKIPGNESMNFNLFFPSVSIDEGQVAFEYSGVGGLANGVGAASHDEFSGVYTTLSGSLTKVIAAGDVLDGKVVSRASMGRQGLQGNQILTDVLFEDHTSALYLAIQIPEPATIGLLVCGGLGLVVMMRMTNARGRQRGITRGIDANG